MITVEGNDAFHISHALRMRVGEHITVCDTDRNEYECKLVSITPSSVTAEILSAKPSENEPPYIATVYQALVKGDKFDTVVQKAVETGASRIVPVLSARCTARPDAKALRGKLERWNRIAEEASKQCGRAVVVKVSECMTFAEAVAEAKTADLPLFCYEADGTESLRALADKCDAPKSVSVFIGPEGGFESAEADAARKAGMRLTGLGKRILRTETASSFVLSCISFEYEL